MAEYALQPVGHDPYAQALEPVAHDPWFAPHAHEPLIVPVQARPSTAPAPIAPDMAPAPERSPNLQPAAAGSGNDLASSDLGGLADTWFPPRPAGSPFNVPDPLATPTAQRAQERMAAAPLQVGTPGADDAFLQHEPGQPFWPYAQSAQDMSFQQALQAAGGGPEFPAMPAPAAPQAMPTWQDPATVEASVGPQPPDWQKGLEASLRQAAPPGSGLAQTAGAIPSLVGMTPAGSIADVGQSWSRGDLAGAGLAALGALPGVGAGERVAGKAMTAAEKLAARREAAGLGKTLEAPGANALPQAAEGLGASLAPNEVPGIGRLGIGGNRPPVDRSVPLLRQENPFSPHLDDMHPDEAALTVNDILHPDTPAPYKPRKRDVETIGAELDQRAQDALRQMGVKGGRIVGPDPVTSQIMANSKPGQPLGSLGNTDELLARNLASEAREAMRRGGFTSVDWYSKKFQDAMAIASTMHPEIATDPHAATAYRAALAITSQGETVPSNVKLADEVYSRFKANGGRFDAADIEAKAKNGPAMRTNLGKINDLLDAMGPEGVTELLSAQRPVRDWNKMGYKIEGENADTLVHGSAILGPKIGGGFYQNLSGNFDPTTFDLWWMRKFGRTTGNLIGLRDTVKQRARLEAELASAAGNTSLPPEIQALAAKSVPKTAPALFQRAADVAAAHERHYSKFGKDYISKRNPGGLYEKSELAKAAIAYRDAIVGINEAPTGGGQRNWMRAVTQRAREILADHGIHMTNADLQATLWYPEKDLYAKLGGKPSEGLNVDYATAHRDLARSKGVSDDRIHGALAGPD